MPNSNAHCQICPFAQLEPAGLGTMAALESDLAAEFVHEHSMPQHFNGLDFQKRAKEAGLSSAQVLAARGCAKQILEGQCRTHEYGPATDMKDDIYILKAKEEQDG
ncbi:hypothetical protein HY346_00610 [Candidatus Microgenomates bacterium]|nr:hypothetical protein [Candidatus Microgenomates bacterium]